MRCHELAFASPRVCAAAWGWAGQPAGQPAAPGHGFASPSPASACLQLLPEPRCTGVSPAPRDQQVSGVLPTSWALQPFSFEPSLPCCRLSPCPAILTVPALAPLVPLDEAVAKKYQNQQGQPDTQDNAEHVDGLLPCKAEGEGALQTNASRRLGILIIPWGGQDSRGAGIRPSAPCCPCSVEGPRSTRLLSDVAQRFLLPPKPCAGDL